jgi:hypothetical protein
VHKPPSEEVSEDEEEIIVVDEEIVPLTLPSSSLPVNENSLLISKEPFVIHQEGTVLKQEEEELEKEEVCIVPSPELSTLETAEVSKETKVLELEQEKEESLAPLLPAHFEQLEPKIATLLTPPLFNVDFVIPSHSFYTSPCLYDFIYVCDASVKEVRTEECSYQREGNILGSLQRRRLLPLWIFKQNLQPD